MLEQLQRLQTHLRALKTRLAYLEKESSALQADKAKNAEAHHAQVISKNSLITQKQDAFDQLNDQHAELKGQFNKLTTDAQSLAERYARLEKSCNDLKNRFQDILTERNELRAVKEKLQNEQRHAQQEIQRLTQERDALLHKNDHAKAKVEAIIERLAILGTAQDQNAQEIHQLAHPIDSHEDVQS